MGEVKLKGNAPLSLLIHAGLGDDDMHRLADAAPDLLAACEWARTKFRCVPHLDDPNCDACSGYNPVDKAISKAKGTP